jgi:hypothetical protein
MFDVPHLKLAYSAGTKHPDIAIIARRPVWRKYVLLPLMLEQSYEQGDGREYCNTYFGPCMTWKYDALEQ